jgi:hypothetical protein
MKCTCVCCSAVSLPEQQPGQREDRIERRAELVRHVRQKAGFQLVGAPQMVGPLVEFGIQSHDAAIGVLQFLVQMEQLIAAFFQLLKLEQHFPVLLSDFFDRIGRRVARQRPGEGLGELRDVGLADRGPVSGERFGDRDPGAAPRPGLDRELPHQTLRAAEPDPEASGMARFLGRLACRRNAGAMIRNHDFERGRAG